MLRASFVGLMQIPHFRFERSPRKMFKRARYHIERKIQ